MSSFLKKDFSDLYKNEGTLLLWSDKGFDIANIAAMGAGLAGQALQGYANKYLNTGDLYNDIIAKGILGDTSSGTLGLLFDNVSGNSMNNALEAISNSRNVSAGATTNLSILNAYKGLKPVTSLQKPKGNASNILGSTLKGAATGFAAGTVLPGIGNIVGTIGGAALGLIGGVGTLIGLNKRYETLNEAEQNNYRQALNNLSLAAYNTSKLSNLNSLRNMSRYGGYINRFDLGGDLLNLISVDAGGSHEQNPYGGVFVNSNSTVELNEKISTDGKKLEYVWSDTLKVPKDLRKKYKLKDDITFAEAIEKVNKEASERVLDPISKNGQNAIFNEFKQSLEELRIEKELKEMLKQLKKQRANSLQYTDEQDLLLQNSINSNIILNALGGYIKLLRFGGNEEDPLHKRHIIAEDSFPAGVYPLNAKSNNYEVDEKLYTTNSLSKLENLRYAPILGNTLGLIQNLFTSEDYSMPNRLLKEINALPKVSVPKNTNYMTYNPIDTNRYVNQYNANAAAARNAVMNTTNPNRNASLLVTNYNNAISYGDLVLAIEAQNQKEKLAVLQFNASIDAQNNANLLQVAQLNQGYDLLRILGIMEELALRDAVLTAKSLAISSNLNSLIDSIAGVGTEAYNRRSVRDYLDANLDYTAPVNELKSLGYDLNHALDYYKKRGATQRQLDNIKNLW